MENQEPKTDNVTPKATTRSVEEVVILKRLHELEAEQRNGKNLINDLNEQLTNLKGQIASTEAKILQINGAILGLREVLPKDTDPEPGLPQPPATKPVETKIPQPPKANIPKTEIPQPPKSSTGNK